MHLVFLLFLAFAAVGAADAAAQGPSISVDSPTVTEGDSGSSNLTFTLTLSAVSTEQVRVRFSDKGTGTATAGTDYPAFLLQWVRFQPGELTKTVSIAVTGDTVKEPNETIVVELLYPQHATIATPTGTGTITDDDTTPGLSISSPRVTEGNSGSKNLTYTVSLTAASTQQVTVDYADAGTGTATSGTDYTAITGGTLTFAVGTTSQTFNVSVTGDTDVEPHETVVVSLSDASGATISTASGTGTIVNDDGASSLSVSSLSVVEANTAIRFTVTLGTARSESVRVTWWDTREGTATADLDYSSPGYNSPGLAWLTFAPGEVSKTTNQIWVREDGREESDETIIVAASVAADGSGRVTGTATIEDDDGPALSIDSPSVTEGDSGSKTLTFTVKLDKAAAEQVTVDYADAGTGTATSGTDYTAITGGTLTFAAGTTSQTFNVSVTGDADEEPNETVVAMLSNAANAMISTATGTGTIVNDDGVTVSIDSPSVIEGNSGSKNLTFTATLSKSSAQQVTVNYADAGTGTAISGTDYTAITGGTLTFAAGTTSQTFNVSVTGDTTDEADETVIVTLSNAANATILTATGTGTITDDDRTPSLSIDSPSVTEGDSGSTTLTFTVTLNKVSADQVTVDYADAGTGTATSGTDYTAITGGSLTFAAGTTSQTFDVSVTGDTTDEADETVKVTLSNAANATYSKSTGTGTITDNDDAPSLSIDSPSVTEGDSGSKNLTFTATLSAASGQQVTVDWAEGTGGTATSGTDYGAISGGTLTFAIGTTSQTFNVSVTGDTDEEPNETVVAMLSNATNATIATATGTGTIVNDDGLPALSINSPRVTEGDSGSKNLTFTVTLNKAGVDQVTVDWAEGTGGTATSGTDYTAITGGTLTFAVGTTSQTFDVSVTGDTDEEQNETVVAMLSNAANATISTATGTGTIVNDDGVTVSIDSPSVTEGDSGSTNLTFTATLSKASTQQVTVNYADAGTGTATSGTDYTTITGGTLTFAVGTTSQTFDVSVTGDTDEEADETVIVTLSNAANATISTATGTGTITDNDGTPTVSINSPSVTEGDSGSKNLTFTVTLNRASTQQVTVDYADAGTGTATSGTDYTAISGGTLTFAVGTTSQTFDVSVTGDTTDEADETVVVTLSNAANARISTATGTGTITDNDDAPTLSINSPRVNEGDSGSTNLTFTATLSAASGQQVTVNYADAGTGTATAGTDYPTITGGVLTFPVGTTSQTFDVSVTGDTTEEPNETVVAMLSNATNATIATATGTGTIVNDDGLPALSINSPRVTEGDSGSKNLTFTVTLNKAGVDQVTVDWAEGTGGTATSGTDYTTITGGTLTFAVGITSQTFDVSVTGDTDEEPNETVVAMLSNAANATISTATGTGTIVNDDGVTVSIDSPSVTEGDSGSKNLTFTATLSKASTQQVTVNYADAGTGTATSGTDYTAIAGGTLTFAAGITSQTFDVSVTGDTDEETDETVVVTLSNAANATISTATGTGTITDNDGTPTVSIDSPSVTEGDSGSPTLTFTLTLSKASTEEVRVRFSDKGTGTATAGTDYTAFSIQWLYFQPGELTKTVSIAVTGDTVKEPNETIVVELLHPLYATIATPTGTGTITDDDTTPALSISSPRVTEGDSGSKNLTYTVSLTAAGTQQVTVDYADAGTGTATSGTDYTAITGGALTFAVGTTSQTVNVSVTGDTDVEPHETVVVSLSNASGATISTASGTGTIINDDGASSLSVSSLSVTEGDTAIRFTVSLSAARSQSVRVTWWDTGEGTATAGEDYGTTRDSSPGRVWLTFAPGEVSKTTNQIWLREDNRDETDETIIVAASEAADGAGRVTGTATIEDDDGPALSIDSPSVTEGDSGSTNLTYTVSLAAASVQQVTVDWAEGTGGTATAGTDYTAITGGTLTFPAGTTSQTFDVSVTGDTTDEADETVVVTLSNAVNATISTATGTGTITDDDGPALSIDSPSVTEGDSGSKTLTFTVKLDKAAAEQVTVDYADAGTGTATSGTDYTAITGGTLTFAAGTTSQTFDVSVTGDTDEEPNETVVAMLSNAANAMIATATGTGTIVNDDGVTVSIDSPSVTEGDSGSTNLTFTATLSKASTQQVTVNYADAGTGTATSGTDYTAITGGTLTFPVGITSQTFNVSVTGDTDEEADETVIVTLSGATNATISTATGTGTITNDDGVTVSIDSPSVTEGDSGSKNLTFTVTLNRASTQQVTVDYADAGTGTATSGTDYTAITGGSLTFAVGTTSQTFNVSVTGDTTDEANETILVTLSNAANATISTATGTGTITDNDDAPTLSIDSPRVTEGDSGSKNLTFTATLSAASGQQVTVDWAEGTGGTATSGTDYGAISGGTLTFAIGTTSQTFDVSVTGDTDEEPNETVVAMLSNATNATIATATGTGTIVNDDGLPALSINSPRVTEGDSGSKNLTFTVTLNKAGVDQVTVDWAEGTGGTATSGTDYTVITGGTLTFAVGTTSQTFDVSVTGDTDEEQNETVVAMLSNAANATISTATGTGTIVNDDGVTVSIDSPSVTEGDSGSTTLTFTATLNKASTQQVTVDYADAGTGTAVSGTDYTAITGGTLTFAVGITSQTFNVSVTGDTDEEADETVIVTLSGATNATISTATGTGTITDNDGTPTVSINSPSVTEGDSGSKNLTFTVTLNRASTQQVTVDYADAGTGTATSGTDYTAISGGTLTFAVGTTSQTFDVSVTGDTTDEADETVVVTLSNAANARISTATGTGTITDNDDAPTLSINSPRVNEGDSGSTNLTFTATLSAASGQQVTVNYADAGTGTATAGTDYPTITGGVLTFPVGTTSQTFDVSVTGDTTEEPNETVVAMLSNATNATIATATGTGTIVNDDGLPALSINSPRVTEGDSGSKNLTFTVTLNKAGVDQVTVDWAEGTGGTATSGTDYTTITGGTLTFAVGITSQTFDVSVTGDTDEEPNETVVAMLSNAANATISTATGTGTIVNDDGVTVSIDSPSVTEGDSGSKNLTFTATLSKASTQQVTVNYADAGTGTATSGTDYTAIAGGTLTFAAGITSQTFDVSVTGDTDEETDETVVVTLSNAANATISTATGTGTITDNDGTPTVSIDSPSVTEGDSGSPTLTFTLTLSKASTEEVRVRFSDKGTGTATAGTDYTAFSIQWLYFQPGELTKTVSIAVTGDTVKEPNETIVVELLYPLYATIATPTGTGTITDDDTTPALSISSPRVTEGDSGSKNLTYTVSLTAAGTQQVTVDYADAGTGTATSGTDYTAITGGALTFAVGTTSQTVNVSVTGDTDVEPHETVVVSLSNASGATISTASGTGTIVNDDGASSLSVSSLSVTEGDTAIRFTVSLSAARSQSVRVTWWDTGEGTATAGEDYGTTRDSSPGRVWLTFAPGEVSKTTNQIWVRQDNLAESDETIIVAASEAADGAGRVTGTATIKDDDGAPSLSIDSPSVTEGDSGSTNLTFTATLSRSSTRQVTVDWAEGTGGTATSGTDYTAITGGTLTFAAGTTSQTFDVSVTGDTTDEADETVVVTLSNASGATISTGTGTGTITDDDDAPSLSIDSPRVTEGDSGSKDLTFTVKLSAASGEQVTVDWAEGTGGTATSGTDYTTITGGTLTFAAGITSQTFNVSVTGDTDEEPNETVVAMLSNAANATISTATGTGTIVNDDGVTISINSPSVTEGDSGSKNLTFTATLNKASAEQVTVDYADAGTGTATSGTDYTAITGGTLTFPVGTTSQTFDVSVTGDTDEETDETVIVTLSNAANATILTATGTGTITDDDRTPSLSINSPSVTEGDSGSTNLTFTVTLNKASADQVTVDWAEGTGGTATSGTDYTAITGGSLTFAVGTTSQTFNVSVTGDTTDEADETVIVTLSNAANATISTATGTGTITDNDDAPTLSINSPRVTEGDSGSTNLTFTATLSAASGKQVTVDWAEGTGGTATSGTDYTTINGGTLTFAVGTTSQTFNVSVTGDTDEEPNETVVAMLSNAANATISTATGTGTIVNDDGLPALSINSPRVTEGDSGSKNLRFTVTLNKAGVDQVTVDWAEGTGGTATSGTDYTTITGGTLTFAVGTTSQTFDVSVTGDTDEEQNETVVAMLSNAANATISTATGTGTIVNDDGVTVSIDSPSVTEGDSGSTTLTFTATLSKASTQQVTVNYADAGTGTATSGTDYTAITGGTLTFAVGTTSQTFDVSVTGDTDEETDETVIVTLSNAANATILTATGTGTITDNDGTPTLSINSPSVTEGDSGSPTLTFTLTLSKASTEEVRVRFSDKGTGTATAGTDYPAFSLQWLYFQPGELTKTVSIAVTGDTVKEPNETIVVELLHPLYATIATPTGTGTITDDDTTPALSISSPRVTEGDSGSVNLTYTVSLTAAGTQQVTVNYADAGTGTATSGTDYTAITGGALTFAVGTTSQTFNVSVTGDTDVEPHETVVVSLSDAANATILTATGTGTIVNDDGASSLSVSSLSVTEADTTIRFTVTLGTARSESVRVTWWDTGEGTATVGEDYGSTRYSSPGRAWLTFAPGEVSKTTNQIWLREDNR